MSIDQRLLETKQCTDDGCHPLVDYGEWRVAVLSYIEELEPANIDAMECQK